MNQTATVRLLCSFLWEKNEAGAAGLRDFEYADLPYAHKPDHVTDRRVGDDCSTG